ncbi:cytochrome P450 [Pararhizobium sp.]|uniref:cytochrome P450 n=1 Tax=Pararhizobium sp. TaxID=1977563 RepID=UPI00271EA800|nr:cytochrome P450 [Pararhizobium sp.]MDO9415962.1 cytochrome P450 [Pararhizobium sp.]
MSSTPSYLSIDPMTRRVSLDGRNSAFYSDPNAAYAAFHAHAPTFYWEEQKQWYFTGYDQVNGLLRDRRFGRQILHVASRDEIGMPAPSPHLRDFDAAEAWSLLELEPPEHTRLRTLINRAFVSRQIERLRPEVTALTHQLIDAVEKDHEVELLSAFADIIPVTIIARMLGIPAGMGPQLLIWSHAYVRMYMFGRTRADEDAANQAAAEFSDYVKCEITKRRANPGDDLLTHMIVSDRNGQHMSEDELVSTTIVLLNAGHEATVHQIGNAVRTILSSGLDPAAMFSDETTTARTVEECLRIAAPVHIFQRYALAPLELDGIRLERGDKISLILAAANLDPKQFTDPLTFKPERDEGPNLSFGAGIHFCIGAPLARLELTIALSALFARLPGLKLAAEPVVKDVYHFHGLERLELAW